MTSGTRHLLGQVRPGRRLELQRRAAGDRDGERAEGRPGDHRHHARSGERRLQHELHVAATAPGGAGELLERGACSNTGATFTITSGSGTCTVKYDQAGDANYNAAPQVTETVNAQKANQTIIVTLHAPATAVYNTSFSVAATAAARATRSRSRAAASCSNTGATFTMTSGTGTCTVKYDQAGNANYNAAPQVTETVERAEGEPDDHLRAAARQDLRRPGLHGQRDGDSGLAVSFGATGPVHRQRSDRPPDRARALHDHRLAGAATATTTPRLDVPRTFTVNSPAETVAELTAKDATCTQVSGGTAPALSSASYVEKNGVIKKAIPNTAVYWVKVHLTAGTHAVEVDQAITSGNFTQKLTLANGSKAYTAACGKVKKPTFTSGPDGSVTVGLNAPSTADYRLAVIYKVSAINGQPTPSPTTVHYLFSTAGVSGSAATLDLLRQVAARRASRCVLPGAPAPVRLAIR